MKKILIAFLFFGSLSYGQTKGISYQALIIDPVVQELPGYNNTQVPLSNRNICLKFSFIDELNSLEYEEIFTTTTDDVGMVNLIIGTEDRTGGYASSFEDIAWSSLPKNLKVDLSVNDGCSNFIEISNAPFTAVPYALFALNTENTPLVLDNEAEIILLKSLLATTQLGAGLNSDGTYSPNASSNFITVATSLNNADTILDGQVKNNETTITTNTSDIASNAAAIANNTISINTNSTDIAVNSSNITTNTSGLADNTTAINERVKIIDIVDDLTSGGTMLPLSAEQGKVLKNLVDTTVNILVDDNLTSTSTTNALSANQGRELKGITDTNSTNIATNVTDIATNTSGIATNVTDIATNTAKVGITTEQASAIVDNTTKVGITTEQASAIENNTAKVGISTEQASAIVDNTAKVGITTGQASAIVDNTAKVGITTEQASAIENNTAKVGITTDQASAIVDNTAKVGITTEQASAIVDNTTKVGITTEQVSAIENNTAKVGITTEQASAIVDNTTKVGITTEQASAIENNTAKVGISTEQASAIVDNTAKVGITTGQASAIVDNTAKVGITTEQASAIENNTAKVGITTDQASAIVDNTAKVGITTEQASAIEDNTTNIATNVTAISARVEITNIIDDLTSGGTTVPLSAEQGKVLKGLVDSTVNITVEDNLTSTSTSNALSANQGRELKALLDSNTSNITGAVMTTGDQTIAGAKTFSSTIVGDINGNAATATTLETARNIAGNAFDGSGNITIAAADLSDVTDAGSGSIISSTERTKLTNIETSADVTDATNVLAAGAVMTTGDQTIAGAKTFSSTIVGDINGNAATATTLETARNIAGNAFDGSGNITIAAADLSDVTDAGSGSIISSTERTKLTNIETSADVTDATNVLAAGAVMTTGDQTIAGAKTFSSTIVGDINGNAATATTLETARNIAGNAFDGSGNITIAAADLSDVTDAGSGSIISSAERTKLINVEDGADVTDTDNVTTAGALMDSEVTDLAGVKTVTISTLQVKPSEGAFADGDKTKLDGIAAGAQVNVSGDSGNAAVYDNSGTPTLKSGITKTEIQTLINVEDGADVTDTDNVTTAGALMDSEVTDLAGVKTVTISTLQVKPSEGAFADGDKTKLDGIAAGAQVNVSGDSGNAAVYDNSGTPTLKSGITKTEIQTLINVEDGADVTDTDNVTTAGALMDSEVTDLAGVKTVTISTLQVKPSEGAFADGDKTKLDGIAAGAQVNVSGDSGNAAVYDNSGTPTLKSGITKTEIQTLINVEDGADVTDTDNVTTAGALMDSEVTDLAGVKTVTISTLQVKPSEGAFADGDKTKLDGIAAGAQVNVSGDSGNAAVYDNSGTPTLKSGITKTEIQTLINVEDGADVTDTDNVTTAGALMDSEVTDLAGVKTVTISTLQVKPSEGAFADGDKTKLDGIAAGAQVNVSGDSGNAAVYDNSGTPTLKSGITKTEIQTLINVEDGADVTDTDNVTTAGALMDSEVTDLAGVKTVTISTLQVKPSEGAFADGDKTKLDGIAAGAQVNVSGDSGNAAVYDNSGTPTLKSGITKTEIQTLINVEDGADVTDTDNVTTAGALMDSEVTDLAGVKTVTISTLQVKPSEGAFADGDKTKLDGIAAGAQVNVSGDSGNAAVYDNSGTPTLKSGITKTEIQTLINVEDGADVTDTDNVTTAGALMDSEVTDLAGVKTVTISTLQVKPSEGAFADGDKTKLDGIAAGAQVNVSGDSGNAAVYDNSGTPTLKSGITKTEIQTLINVEDGAKDDQTAAEVVSTATTNIAALTVQTALAELDDEKLALAGGTMTGNITMNGTETVDGRDLSVDGAKLDLIEPSATADQTAAQVVSTATGAIEATNVDSAIAELEAEKLALAGGTMTGNITMGANDISGTGSVTATTFSGNLIGNILDSNENELVKGTATASAVNEITVTNAATGNGPTISATGSDTNIDLNIEAKGTGIVNTSGDLTVGGTIDVTGSTSMAAISSDGVVTLSNNTTSTSSTTGALKVTGGVGVAENLNVGGALDVTGDTNLNSTTTSTSSSTGALVVDGGVGVAENLNVGGAIDVTDAATTRNNLGIYGGSLNWITNGDDGFGNSVADTEGTMTLPSSITLSSSSTVVLTIKSKTIGAVCVVQSIVNIVNPTGEDSITVTLNTAVDDDEVIFSYIIIE